MFYLNFNGFGDKISGYKWMDIAACVQWMTPFAMTLRDVGPAELKFFSQIPTEDTHAIQTHSVDLNLLVRIST